jgi:hypothetical protein
MARSSLALVVGLFAVASAAGNGLPPPVLGKKFVPADHVITAEKAFPDHDFYLVTGGAPKKVEFGPDAPVRIGVNRPRGVGSRIQFVAVPKGAAEKYADADAFTAALFKGTVPGQAAARHTFPQTVAIDARDMSRSVTETHVVERVDAKEGIVFRAAAPAKDAPPGKAAPDPPGPRGGGVVAGLAVALAMAFTGLRLARRRP